MSTFIRDAVRRSAIFVGTFVVVAVGWRLVTGSAPWRSLVLGLVLGVVAQWIYLVVTRRKASS